MAWLVYLRRNSWFCTATLETVLLEAYLASNKWSMRVESSSASRTTRSSESPSAEMMIADAFSFFAMSLDECGVPWDFSMVVGRQSVELENESTTFHTPFTQHAAQRCRRQCSKSSSRYPCKRGILILLDPVDFISVSDIVALIIPNWVKMRIKLNWSK